MFVESDFVRCWVLSCRKCVEVICHFTNSFDQASKGDRSDNKNWRSDFQDELDLLLGASNKTNGIPDLSHRSHEEMSTSAYLNLSLKRWTSKNMQLRMFSVACEFGSILRWCSWSQQEGLPWWWCLGTMLCGFAWCRKAQQFLRTLARDMVIYGQSNFLRYVAWIHCYPAMFRRKKRKMQFYPKQGAGGLVWQWNDMKLHDTFDDMWSESKDLNRPVAWGKGFLEIYC